MTSLRLTIVDPEIVPVTSVITDYQDKTVLKGLASVGGLLTSLSGIFALLFGCGLLYSLLGRFCIFQLPLSSDLTVVT